MPMTNYDKWDRYVAALSDEEEEEPDQGGASVDEAGDSSKQQIEDRAGWGMPLNERGQIDRSGELTVGNAKGNALSTNAKAKKEFEIAQYSWDQTEDAVAVTVPVNPRQFGIESFAQDNVKATMLSNEVVLSIYDKLTECTLRFGLTNLPGIVPEESSFHVSQDTAPNAL